MMARIFFAGRAIEEENGEREKKEKRRGTPRHRPTAVMNIHRDECHTIQDSTRKEIERRTRGERKNGRRIERDSRESEGTDKTDKRKADLKYFDTRVLR